MPLPFVPPPTTDIDDWPEFIETMAKLDRLHLQRRAADENVTTLLQQRHAMEERAERLTITALVKGEDPPSRPDLSDVDKNVEEARRLRTLLAQAVEETEDELLDLPARHPHQVDAVAARLERA